MRFVDAFRDPEVITKTAEAIRRLAEPSRYSRILEVRGGRTCAVCRFGPDILPTNVESSMVRVSGLRS